MSIHLSGPLFEASKSEYWHSIHGKEGAHYNQYRCKDSDGLAALKKLFPDGVANELNFVLFSTSGIHGQYTTIEELFEDDGDGGKLVDLTFLVIHPRLCCMRYGNLVIETQDDVDYLKKLRASSLEAVKKIGMA